ncbi:uncharacterized protein LOC125083920 isoform X5 [Lutra lutra]|uniref:uncharacterized protein LOC125083920 isoform X5 n=1 Tax=Lutra lutra TaxID=9657 RepID=UPI001FD3FF77|nr:uncharacterized protein LOC125083920 isoform X5 [Lutra lutra]
MLVLKEMALSSTSTFGKRAKLKETAACSRSDIWTLSGAGAAGASGPGAPPGTQLEELSREKLRRGEARGRIGKDLNEWVTQILPSRKLQEMRSGSTKRKSAKPINSSL